MDLVAQTLCLDQLYSCTFELNISLCTLELQNLATVEVFTHTHTLHSETSEKKEKSQYRGNKKDSETSLGRVWGGGGYYSGAFECADYFLTFCPPDATQPNPCEKADVSVDRGHSPEMSDVLALAWCCFVGVKEGYIVCTTHIPLDRVSLQCITCFVILFCKIGIKLA